ncbi:S8 family serine peptidase [Marinobacter metalliresistant]|uniref:S8 family serine peptidase n=1 Tax=Marinobacter metalliresistant TaxID=2961995 RepID=A0ABZ2W5X2_9GAMM
MAMPDLRMASLASPERETLAWIEELRQHSGVASAVPDYRVSAHTPLDEPLYPEQWHYGLINAPTAWQLAANGGLGAVVAVLDTGLFRDSNGWHPDLADNVVNPLPAGTDFVSGDNNPQDPGNDIGSNVFHGTHVAGTVAASASNQIGGTGVAFNSEILPVRVLGEGGTGSSSDLIDAIVWIGGADSPKADVVNLSLGGLPEIELLQNAITSIVNNGVIVVAAAGNQTSSVRSYPAAAQSVFAVSGVDGAGNIATYSNFGPWVDLAAPGGDGLRDANLDGRADLVISTSASISSDGFFVPDYIGLQGTSMASPHVAGVFALMKSIKPDLDYGTLKAWLEAGALTDPVEGGRSDELGYGVINAAKAVMAAIDNPSITVLSASPSVVSLSSETNPTQVVDLQVFGGFPDTVTIESAIASPDWLDVSLVENPLSLTLMLNTDNLSPDIPARTTLTVNYTSDSARTLKLPVVAELVTDETSRNAGQHFILLVNTVPDENDFFQAEAQVVASAIDGEYQFGFRLDDGVEPKNLNEVSPGTYYLVGGTDLDNDGVICQPGEACAEYPVAGLREMVQVDESTDLTGIRMITGYSRPSISSASRDVLPRPGFEGYRLIDKVLPGNRDSKKVGVNP